MRRLLPVLAVALVLAIPGPAGAQDLDEPAALDVRISDIAPVVPAPDKTLRLDGTVANRTDDVVTAVQVRLLLATAPLSARYQIPEVTTGTYSDGIPTTAVSQPLPELVSGGRAPWSLSIPFDDLPLSSQGVYPIGVEVLGTTPDGIPQRLGISRTFLNWFPDPAAYEPTRVVWLWPVTQAPDRALESTTLSSTTAQQMAPGGRLDTLATGPGTAPVTWVVDPAVLQTGQVMADGYTVETDQGPEPGTGGAAASDWLESMRKATDEGQLTVMPYGYPDATALVRARLGGVLQASGREASPVAAGVLRKPPTGTLAWVPGGNLNAITAGRLRQADTSWLLMSDTALPPALPLAYTPSGIGEFEGLPTVLSDSGLTTALAGSGGSRDETVRARQQFLAEVGMVTAELPTTSRTVVAAPDPAWSPRRWFLRTTLRALQAESYAELVPLRRLTGSVTELTRSHTLFGPDQRAQELPDRHMARLRVQQAQVRRFLQVLTETAAPLSQAVQARGREASAWWRTDLETGSSLVRLVGEQQSATVGRVRIASGGVFTLPGNSAPIPVTIANDLAQDVRVGLRMETDQPARLQSEDVEPVVVPAGRKVSVEVDAVVAGSGSLPVRLQLTTAAGRPFGEPVLIEVRTTAYAVAAGYVVGAAFILLTAMLAVNFMRRRRVRRERRGRSR